MFCKIHNHIGKKCRGCLEGKPPSENINFETKRIKTIPSLAKRPSFEEVREAIRSGTDDAEMWHWWRTYKIKDT